MQHPLHSARVLCVAFALLLAFATPSLAQEAQPTDQPAPAAEPSPDRPGLFDGLGRLLQKPAEFLPSLSKSGASSSAVVQEVAPAPPPLSSPPPSQAVAAPAAPSAVEPPPTASTRLFPGMATGREVCPRSPNGAPDCQAGADRLCQSKGYKGGKSLNMDSAFGCSSRQARADGGKACGTEHFVTSAFCN